MLATRPGPAKGPPGDVHQSDTEQERLTDAVTAFDGVREARVRLRSDLTQRVLDIVAEAPVADLHLGWLDRAGQAGWRG